MLLSVIGKKERQSPKGGIVPLQLRDFYNANKAHWKDPIALRQLTMVRGPTFGKMTDANRAFP